MKRDLLEGDIKRQLLRLFVPLLIGSVLQQLYNTVDALIIGSILGTNAFSAIGLAGSIMNLLIFVLTGFCNGITVIFGQVYGAGDRRAFRCETFVALVTGGTITLILCALSFALLPTLLRLIQTPDELMADAATYLNIIIAGMFGTFLYNLFSAMLRAVGNTRAATICLSVAVTVNAVTDYVFIKLLGLGVSGAALATVLSQFASALLCLLCLRRHDRTLMLRREDMRLDRALTVRTLSYGFGSALQQSSLYIGKIFVQGAVDTLGTAGIAAFTAASRIESFANSIATSFGQAVTVFVSQNRGAGRLARVRESFRTSMRIALVAGVPISALMFLTAQGSVRIFLKAEEAIAIAEGAAYISTMSLFYIFCFTGNTFSGCFRGMGHIYYTVVGTTLQIAARAVLANLLVSRFGLRAVAFATGIGWGLLFAYQCVCMSLVRRELKTAEGGLS